MRGNYEIRRVCEKFLGADTRGERRGTTSSADTRKSPGDSRISSGYLHILRNRITPLCKARTSPGAYSIFRGVLSDSSLTAEYTITRDRLSERVLKSPIKHELRARSFVILVLSPPDYFLIGPRRGIIAIVNPRTFCNNSNTLDEINFIVTLTRVSINCGLITSPRIRYPRFTHTRCLIIL